VNLSYKSIVIKEITEVFADDIEQEICIRNRTYKLAEHPSFSGVPFGQEGRQGTVYKLIDMEDGTAVALKIFRPAFRQPTFRKSLEALHPLSFIPGLAVTKREVLNPEEDTPLLEQFSDLLYSVMMPWVEGKTWSECKLDETALLQENGFEIAFAFVKVLMNLEQEGISHSDLSGANVFVILDKDEGGPVAIELVDIEDIFAQGMVEPEYEIHGESGYTPKFLQEDFLWDKDSSRFAGAILLSEMLGWHSSQVREISASDSYFEPQELQEQCERYQTLHMTLEQSYGIEVASLFARTWNAESMSECPAFGEWMIALSSYHTQLASRQEEVLVQQNAEGIESEEIDKVTDESFFPFVDGQQEQDDEVDLLTEEEPREVKPFLAPEVYATLAEARLLEQKGKLPSALWEYGRLIEKTSPYPEIYKEIELVMGMVQEAIDESLSAKQEKTGVFNKFGNEQGTARPDVMYKNIWLIVWFASGLLVVIAWIIYLLK
jgi:hypothetical protein